MALNLVPFDSTRPMSETKKTTRSTGVEQPNATTQIRNERHVPAAEYHAEEGRQKASNPNRRKKKGKEPELDEEFELYTRRQTKDHHLVTESLDEEEHQLDIKV